MAVQEQRLQVAAEARSWCGTRFENNAHIKGVGVDCAWTIASSFNAAIGLNLIVRSYPPQWYLHKNCERKPWPGCNYKTDEWYIEDLLAAGFVEVEVPQLADIALSKLGYAYCHGGILVRCDEERRVVHAEARGGKVVEVNMNVDWYYQNRRIKFFSRSSWVGIS
jgi:hypothetical protein